MKIGQFEAYVSEPAGPGKAPAIVVIPSIFGVNGVVEETCDRYAAAGFLTVAIDPFWRTIPGPLERATHRAEAMKRFESWQVDDGVADLRTTKEWLGTRSDWNGKWAVAGFCFGGRLALVALTRLDADASVAFHGTAMELNIDEADRITKPFSYHFGSEDTTVPMETVERIRAALAGKDGEIYVYEGAAHGFALHDSEPHNEARDLSEQRALAMLQRLKTPAFA